MLYIPRILGRHVYQMGYPTTPKKRVGKLSLQNILTTRNMDIIYRQATPDDVVALLSVMDLALGSEDETVTKPDELPARIERWLPRLSDPSITFWCACPC